MATYRETNRIIVTCRDFEWELATIPSVPRAVIQPFSEDDATSYIVKFRDSVYNRAPPINKDKMAARFSELLDGLPDDYGPRLFGPTSGTDQVHNVIQTLRANEHSRRAVIQLFHGDDLAANLEKRREDLPCTCTLQFTIRNNRQLNAMVMMRSNDAFMGLPHDKVLFDHLYKSMRAVHRFGRTAKFDYLTMVGKIGLVNIEPPSAYMVHATGPVGGARLLFAGALDNNSIAKPKLDELSVDLGQTLGVDMQVMEDALCNWQKRPAEYLQFRG